MHTQAIFHNFDLPHLENGGRIGYLYPGSFGPTLQCMHRNVCKQNVKLVVPLGCLVLDRMNVDPANLLSNCRCNSNSCLALYDLC